MMENGRDGGGGSSSSSPGGGSRRKKPISSLYGAEDGGIDTILSMSDDCDDEDNKSSSYYQHVPGPDASSSPISSKSAASSEFVIGDADRLANFPIKLYKMLEMAENEGFHAIVSWVAKTNKKEEGTARQREQEERTAAKLPARRKQEEENTAMDGHGFPADELVPTPFKVHDADRFVESIMPRFFQMTKLKSFLRQLNIWGFTRDKSRKSPTRGSYYQKCFVRGAPHLCQNMRRIKNKGMYKRGTRGSTTAAKVVNKLNLKPTPIASRGGGDPAAAPLVPAASPAASIRRYIPELRGVDHSSISEKKSSGNMGMLDETAYIPPSSIVIPPDPATLLLHTISTSAFQHRQDVQQQQLVISSSATSTNTNQREAEEQGKQNAYYFQLESQQQFASVSPSTSRHWLVVDGGEGSISEKDMKYIVLGFQLAANERQQHGRSDNPDEDDGDEQERQHRQE